MKRKQKQVPRLLDFNYAQHLKHERKASIMNPYMQNDGYAAPRQNVYGDRGKRLQ